MSDAEKQDWRADGYSWKNEGVQQYPRKPDKGILRTHFFQSFKKRASMLFNNDNLILLHYLGSPPLLELPVHGNSKGNTGSCTRTCPSVLNKIRKEATSKVPTEIYQDLVTKDCTSTAHGIQNPRNLKQIEKKRLCYESEKNNTM